LDLARSSCYYQPHRDDSYNEFLMRLIDEEYTRHPFRGREQLTDWLDSLGHHVNPKRVRRLMHIMGIQAIYPKRKTSIPNKEHKVFPYLLRDMRIEYPNQVWATDITYIRMHPGWMYLVAIMDWYSRYVISWELSNTMDVHFCLEALGNALAKQKPDIVNSDQASQFTSRDFTEMLEASGIRISMDGRGRVYDNIFIERLWRTVKYEEVYLHDYESIREVKEGLKMYFRFYNEERFHSSLNKKTPAAVYFEGKI
jgi:putative transposase